MRYKIHMGYDLREKLAYQVAEFSIMRRTKKSEVSISSINRYTCKNILDRPTRMDGNQLWDEISNAPMSTEFAIARFAAFFLQKDGWSLFMDSDMVCLDDIRNLFALANEDYAVMCVKHNHIPKDDEKFHDAGMIQTTYPRKNWSSVLLINHNHEANKRFTKHDLNTRRGLELHGFYWLSDNEIGELPIEWNFLVDVNEGNLEEQKMLHYTNGSPAWEENWIPKPSDHLWNKEFEEYKQSKQKAAM